MNEKIKFELDSLIKQINTIKYLHCVESKLEFDGDESLYENILIDYQQNVISISELYNSFYTKAVALLSVILPNRLDEFKSCYIYDSKSPVHITHNRTIANFFNKINYIKNPYEEIFEKQVLTFFILQENILKSAEELIDSVLYELENKIQYNFFMDELHCAEELLKKKYVRPAGVVAGVALESHLKTVCKNHNIALKPKDTLGKFIEYLRKANIIDFIFERKLQLLGDTRNLCAHSKDREPSIDEVSHLIFETKKILTELI